MYCLTVRQFFCPQGECPPAVYSNGTLFLFTADPQLKSYQLLSAYDINNPSANPKRINRVLRTAIYDFCFPVTADINVLDPPTPSPPHPLPTTYVVDETGHSHLAVGEIVGIVIGIVVAIVVLAAIIIVFFLWNRNRNRKTVQIHTTDSDSHPSPTDTRSTSMASLNNPSATSSRSETPVPTNFSTQLGTPNTFMTLRNPTSHSVTFVSVPTPETVIDHEDVPLPSRNTQQQVPPK